VLSDHLELVAVKKLEPEDLHGAAKAYFDKLMAAYTGYGMSYEDRKFACMAKVRKWIDNNARRQAAEKKQLKLF
jgi:hypothetical protein